MAGSDGWAVRQVRSAVGPVRSFSAAYVPAADETGPADCHASMWCALGHSWHHRADQRHRSRAPPEPSRAWHRAVHTGPRPRVAPGADGGPSKGHEMDRCQDPLGRPSAAANVGPLSVTDRGRESEGGWAFDVGTVSHGGRVTIVPVIDFRFVGAWRSLVAHQSGGLVVVGSNPAAPTISSANTSANCVGASTVSEDSTAKAEFQHSTAKAALSPAALNGRSSQASRSGRTTARWDADPRHPPEHVRGRLGTHREHCQHQPPCRLPEQSAYIAAWRGLLGLTKAVALRD